MQFIINYRNDIIIFLTVSKSRFQLDGKSLSNYHAKVYSPVSIFLISSCLTASGTLPSSL